MRDFMELSVDANVLAAISTRVTTGTTVRGFVFNAMLDEVVDKRGAAFEGDLRNQVMRKRPSDLLSYPASDYFKLLHLCAVSLDDAAGIPESVRVLGYACAAGFFRSPMGRLLLGIVGRGDPARLMANEPTAYATSFSFGKRTYKRTGERSLELTHAEDFLPAPYNVGALQGALDAVGAKARKVTFVPIDRDAARYDITW